MKNIKNKAFLLYLHLPEKVFNHEQRSPLFVVFRLRGTVHLDFYFIFLHF